MFRDLKNWQPLNKPGSLICSTFTIIALDELVGPNRFQLKRNGKRIGEPAPTIQAAANLAQATYDKPRKPRNQSAFLEKRMAGALAAVEATFMELNDGD